jgi:hypothetical protein
VLVAGADGVAVDPLRSDLLAPPALQRLVHADDQRPLGHKDDHEQFKQDAPDGQPGPASAVEHAVVATEPSVVRQAHDPQRSRDRALAGGKDGSGEQHQRVRPDAAREAWREGSQQV